MIQPAPLRVHERQCSLHCRDPAGLPTMLIPSTSDASLRYFPWATIGLIVVNTVVFFATGMGDEAGIVAYGVEYGNGLHPLQWLSISFHARQFPDTYPGEYDLPVGVWDDRRKGSWGGGGNFWRPILGLWDFGNRGRANDAVLVRLRPRPSRLGSLFSLLGICLVWAPRNWKSNRHWISGGYFGFVALGRNPDHSFVDGDHLYWFERFRRLAARLSGRTPLRGTLPGGRDSGSCWGSYF